MNRKSKDEVKEVVQQSLKSGMAGDGQHHLSRCRGWNRFTFAARRTLFDIILAFSQESLMMSKIRANRLDGSLHLLGAAKVEGRLCLGAGDATSEGAKKLVEAVNQGGNSPRGKIEKIAGGSLSLGDTACQ